jgi:hypothetical protein
MKKEKVLVIWTEFSYNIYEAFWKSLTRPRGFVQRFLCPGGGPGQERKERNAWN